VEPGVASLRREREIGRVSPPTRTHRLAVLASALYAGSAVAALIGFGVLRGVHEATPRLFPGPFGSLLFVGLAVLLLLLALTRGQRTIAPEMAGRLTLVATLPILIAIVSEKWISVELLEYAYDWTDEYFVDARLSDAIYRLWTGLSLLGVSLLLFFALRGLRRRARHVVTLSRLVPALAIFGAAALLTMALAIGAALAVGPLRFGVSNVPASVLWVGIAAQVLRSAAEELYYRGILQTALRSLLVRAGVPAGRPAQVAAIAVVSAGFALEHFDSTIAPRIALGEALWVFAMSCALGAILETSRNLYLAILAHVSINLLLGLLIPLPMTEQLSPFPPPDIAVMWLFVLLFCGIAAWHRFRSAD